MDTKVLEYIIAIADEKSITKAADKFYLSPAAISQQLKKIEDSLGAHLFMRVGGELCLTDVGKIFVNGARSTLYVQNQALSKINGMRTDLKSLIRIATNNHTISLMEKSVLPVFKKSFPEVEVKLIAASGNVVSEYLINGLADIGISQGAIRKTQQLENILLHNDELLIVIPASNPLASRFEEHGVSVEALSAEYFILSKDDDGFRFAQQSAMEKHHFRPQLLCEVSSLKAALHMVENGLGSSLLPASILNTENPAYKIFHFKPSMGIQTSAIYPNAMMLNKPMKGLLSILREIFSEFKY